MFREVVSFACESTSCVIIEGDEYELVVYFLFTPTKPSRSIPFPRPSRRALERRGGAGALTGMRQP